MERLVRAAPGPPLGSDAPRRRPVGRIGGLVGPPGHGALTALARALGPGAQVLSGEPAATGGLVADWDACWLDGEPVLDLDQWRSLVSSGRLGGVEGAFVAAWLVPGDGLRLARDGVGERTLYYAPLPGGLVFASSVRALLATGLVPRTLHLPAVAAYLSYAYLPGRETLVAGVWELLPGEVVHFHEGTITRRRLWELPAEGIGEAPADEEGPRRTLRARLETAVRRRLPPGEAVGATLSGGIDSSLVVALARRLHDKPVRTWSVSFGPGYLNELSFSSLVAEHCRTEHRIVELSPAVVLRHLDEAIALLGKPNGDPLVVPNALLFREAASEVGVVLNGEGGDPCFGGPKNLPMLLAELLGDGANPSPEDPYARERSYLRSHQKCYDDLEVMLAPEIRAAVAGDRLEASLAPVLADARYRNFVTRLMAVNVVFKGGHHILPKVDAVSAPFGVLPRSPLFDRAVVETAFAIPPQLKLRGSVEKYLLKEAVRDLLPAAILERPKSGMLVPVEGWFQGPLLGEARARLLDRPTLRGLVERDYLERLLAGRLRGLRPRRGAKIWLLVTLEAWLRGVLHGPPPAPAC